MRVGARPDRCRPGRAHAAEDRRRRRPRVRPRRRRRPRLRPGRRRLRSGSPGPGIRDAAWGGAPRHLRRRDGPSLPGPFALAAAGGPARLAVPVDRLSLPFGVQPTGNVTRMGFLSRPDRTMAWRLAEVPCGPSACTPVTEEIVGGGTQRDRLLSPGRHAGGAAPGRGWIRPPRGDVRRGAAAGVRAPSSVASRASAAAGRATGMRPGMSPADERRFCPAAPRLLYCAAVAATGLQPRAGAAGRRVDPPAERLVFLRASV